MAAGKSAVGRAAAARLGLDFVDTDAAIEVTHGPIPAIFARGGETLFRELERDVVLDALSAAGSSPAVVALGGGAVTIEAVRAASDPLLPDDRRKALEAPRSTGNAALGRRRSGLSRPPRAA